MDTAADNLARIRRLERATREREAADIEYQAALLDLLTNGGRGAQQEAARITGLTRDGLRRMARRCQQANSDAGGGPG